MRNVKLPDMPMGAASYGATNHNSKVYISAFGRDGNGKIVSPVLVYSTNEHKWSTLPEQQHYAAIAVLNNHVTLIGGKDVSTGKVTNTLSTWYEEEGQWKQVLPPMPTGRLCPAVICHANLLLVTGGLAGDVSTLLNTTDVLDLTTMKWTTPKDSTSPYHYGDFIWPFVMSTSTWWAGLRCILGNHQKISTPRRGEQSGVMSRRLQPHSTSSHKGACGRK